MYNRILITVLLAFSFVGCNENDIPVSDETNSEMERVSGREILDAAIALYNGAETYQDKAVLYLTYRLDGEAIREPHPWSVAWNRIGQFSADLFNAKIRQNGNELSCYVFDIETGNVDNQHLIVAGQDFRYLLDDKIATHFLFGSSELPLDEIETQRLNQLVPPMLGFLDPELFRPWLQHPDSIERLGDDNLAGKDCHVLKLIKDRRTYRLWIDQQIGLIQKIEFPLEYLDSQILASEQVTDLQFFVQYHDAYLDREIESKKFHIKEQLGAKAVSQFVTLPQPLPSERIGEVVSRAELTGMSGKKFDVASTKSDATVLVWLTDFNGEPLLEKMIEIAATREIGSTKWIAIYSEGLLERPGSGDHKPKPSLARIANQGGVQLAYDPEIKLATELKLKSLPSVVLLDRQKRIQYVESLDEEQWEDETLVAIERVSKGESLSAEMKLEYQKFLDQYHEQLAVVASTSKPDKSETQFVDLDSTSVQWFSTELSNPGNILVPEGSNRIFVLDGWQSVVELDAQGRIIGRTRLDIKEGVAIDRLRSLNLPGHGLFFAAFSMLGREVYIFDQSWNRIYAIEDRDTKSRITECQLVDKKGRIEILVARLGGSGLTSYTLDGQPRVLRSGACKSFYKSSAAMFLLEGNKLLIDGKATNGIEDWKFTALRGDRATDNQCFGLAYNDRGYWKLFCLGEDGEVWSRAIRRPLLATQIEPLVVELRNGNSQSLVPISDREFVLFDGEASNKKFRVSESLKIAGLASVSSQNGQILLISDERRLISILVTKASGHIIPASTQRNR